MKLKLKGLLSRNKSPRKNVMDADDEQEEDSTEVTINTRTASSHEEYDNDHAREMFASASIQEQQTSSNNKTDPPSLPMGSKNISDRQTSFGGESISSVDLESSVADDSSSDRRLASVASLPQKRNNQISSRLSLSERTLSYEKLGLFEASRLAIYGPKLRSSSAYWLSFKEMLQSSVEETKYVEQLIRASVLADLNYANHLTAAVEGELHPDGSPRIAKDGQNHRSKKADDGNSRNSAEGPIIMENDKIYSTFQKYLREVSKRFSEEAKSMHEDIVSQVINLREKLDGEVSSMIRLGDFIHAELTLVEESAQDNWSVYYESAFKSLSGFETSEDDALTSTGDLWMLECNYIIAVQYQNEAWTKLEPELCRMFSSMKQMELFRRSLIKEMLVWTMQQKDKMFLGLQNLAAPSLLSMTEQIADSETIDAELKQSIHDGARRNSLDKPQSVEMNSDSNVVVSAAKEVQDDNAYKMGAASAIDSPLTSVLMRNMKIVQRKANRIVGGWKTALAIITADSVLHLFDAPPSVLKELLEADSNNINESGSLIETSLKPEAVFQAILPRVNVPTPEQMVSESNSNKVTSSFFASLGAPKVCRIKIEPTISIKLQNADLCVTEGYKDENSTIDIIETCRPRGATKLLHKSSQRKVHLRTSSRSETMDWVYHMNVANFVIKQKPTPYVVAM